MVLLKNDGVLPLQVRETTSLVVGPLAEQTAVLLGNYNGNPTHTVSVLEGMKAEFPAAQITYVPGLVPVHTGRAGAGLGYSRRLRVSRVSKAEYSAGHESSDRDPRPLASRVEPEVDLNETQPSGRAGPVGSRSVHWTGLCQSELRRATICSASKPPGPRASQSGADRSCRCTARARLGRVHLEQGQPVKLDVEYGQQSGPQA